MSVACENLAPQVISRILSEIRELIRFPPDGVEYSENEEESSINEIYAIISGPDDTPFSGGKFRMKLVLSEDYPSSPPKGYFLTKIYHPNVSPQGDICVNTLKRDWNVDVTLKHILQVIRCLLIVPFPESSLNDEAGKLFMDSYDEYSRRARIMTEVHALAPSVKAVIDETPSTQAGGVGVAATNHANDTTTVNSINMDFRNTANESSLTAKLKVNKDPKKKSMKRL